MTKAEKNYRRDYGHKDSEELALNYSRDSLKEELDNVLENVNFDDLIAEVENLKIKLKVYGEKLKTPDSR